MCGDLFELAEEPLLSFEESFLCGLPLLLLLVIAPLPFSALELWRLVLLLALLLAGFVLLDEGCLVEAALGVEVGALEPMEVDVFADSPVVVVAVTAVEVELVTPVVLGFLGLLLVALFTETSQHSSSIHCLISTVIEYLVQSRELRL